MSGPELTPEARELIELATATAQALGLLLSGHDPRIVGPACLRVAVVAARAFGATLPELERALREEWTATSPIVAPGPSLTVVPR